MGIVVLPKYLAIQKHSLTQSTIVDTNVNEYLNKTIEDQYGLLFQLAQDVTMEDMINGQY